MKVYFLQRVCAYMIDLFLVFLLVGGISLFIPVNKTYMDASNSYNEMFDELSKTGDIVDFYDKTSHYDYIMAKEGFIISIVSFAINIGYYCWYQSYAKGQTIGKRVMKIAIKRKDGSDIDTTDSLKRGVVLHWFLTTLITMIALLFLREGTYMNLLTATNLIMSTIFIACTIMIASRKDGRGLHDMFAGTVVVPFDGIISETIVIEGIKKEPNIEEVVIDLDNEEGSEDNERVSRTRNSKKRKSKGNSKEA